MPHEQMTTSAGINERFPGWAMMRDWKVTAAILVLTVALCLAYSNSFVAQFHFDDMHNIITNHSIRSLWPIWVPFSPPSNTGTVGRPFANFTLALNYAISGERVWSYHLLNLLIHLVAGWSLFGIVRRTLTWGDLANRYGNASTWLALSIALLWALHPLHTSAVTYIIQRCESLMGMLFFLTVYLAIRGWQSPRPFRWQVGAVLTCLAGMGSKEVMVVCPVMILLYDLLFIHRELGTAFKNSRWFYTGLFMCMVVMALLVFSGGKLSAPALQKTYTAWEQITTQPQVILYYLRLVFWPSPLVFDYRWPVATTMMDIVPYAATIVAMSGIVGWTLWKRWPVSYLGTWFFITLAPSSSFVPQPDFAFEYRMYVPLASLVALIVLGIFEGARYLVKRMGRDELPRPQLLKAGAFCVVLVLALSLGVTTYTRNMDYETELILWMDTIQKRPLNYMAHNNAGYALSNASRWTEAIPYFRKSLEINPLNALAYTNLGLALVNIGKAADGLEYLQKGLRMNQSESGPYNSVGYALMKLGKPAEALPYLETSVKINPEHIDALNNLGSVLSELGQKDRARAQFEAALQIKPDDPISHYNLGVVLNKSNKPAEAVPHLQEALKLRPNFFQAYYQLGLSLFTLKRSEESIPYFQNTLHFKPDHFQAQNRLALALLQSGRLEEAVILLQKIVQQFPNDSEGNYNLGTILLRLNKPAEATPYLQRTIELAPEMVDAHNNLGLAWLRLDKYEESRACFQEAIRLKPDYADAHLNLGLVLAKSGRLSEAITHFQKAVILKPTADAHFYLGMALAHSGNTEEAKKNLQTAITMDSRNETAKMALQELQARQ